MYLLPVTYPPRSWWQIGPSHSSSISLYPPLQLASPLLSSSPCCFEPHSQSSLLSFSTVFLHVVFGLPLLLLLISGFSVVSGIGAQSILLPTENVYNGTRSSKQPEGGQAGSPKGPASSRIGRQAASERWQAA